MTDPNVPPSGLIRSYGEYQDLVLYLRSWSGAIAVDTETTGLHPWDGDVLRGISVATADGEWYVPVSHPGGGFNAETPWLLYEVLSQNAYLIFHHCTFDWAFLMEYAKRFPTVFPSHWHESVMDATCWDTQIGNWLTDENQKVGLKESAARILGFDAGEEKRALKAITKETKRTWDTFTAEDIAEYAAMDARLTYDLWDWQLGHADGDFLTAMNREMNLQHVIYGMNDLGCGVDQEHVVAMIADVEAQLTELEQSLIKAGVNPRSPKQLARWLYDDLGYECQVFTKTGQRATNKAALQELAKVSEEADALLRQRTLQKELTAYYRPLRDRTSGPERIGTVHPHFSSTRTVTGRLSCSDPNLMTIPRDDVMADVRRCFVARPGYRLVEFDLKQAELRVIAGYTREDEMRSALEEGRDLHSETAAAVFGPDFTPLQRRLAKNLNFGFPYGIGPRKFATYLAPVPTECGHWTTKYLDRCCECDVCHAAEILDGYRKAYPSLVHFMNALGRMAERDGVMPLEPAGRYRHFKGAGYTVPGYTALNAIVQGGIGEFMKDVMIEWGRERPFTVGPALSPRLVLQIHDALVFEIPEEWTEGISHVDEWLQSTADRVNPFAMRMEWDMKEWT